MIRNRGTNNDLIFRGMSKSRIRILTDNSEIIGACFANMVPSSAYIMSETFDILNIIKNLNSAMGTNDIRRYILISTVSS